jgi:predicted ribosome-associated RNA-binding protein Tma20/translation initiation factor 1 (eIF-1/SUI1)
MFRKEKDLAERSRTLLKNKEAKTLKAEVLKQFPAVTEDEINALLPNKVNLTSIKLVDRTILYTVDDVILFFDVNGRNNLYPSIVTMWKIPHIVKTMVTHGPVSRNLIRGADLMVPGVIQREITLGGLRKKEKCGVRIYGNPLPFAVGDSCFDCESILTARRGKALDIIHGYGDLLVPAHSVVLPPGYFKEEILPTENNLQSIGDYNEDEGDDDDENDQQLENNLDSSEYIDEIKPQEGTCMQEDMDSDLKLEENIAIKLQIDDSGDATRVSWEEEKEENETENVDEENAVIQKSPQEYGEEILHAFVLFLKHVVKDPLLPMLVSTMWPMFQRVFMYLQHEHTMALATVMKKSVFGKPVTLLIHCQSIGLISFDEKTPGVYILRTIQRTHSLFRTHKYEDDAEKLRVVASSTEEMLPHDVDSTNAEDAAESTAPKIGDKKIKISIKSSTALSHQRGGGKSTIDIVELFKLPRTMQEIFRGYYMLNDNAAQETTDVDEQRIYFGDHLLRSSQVRLMLQSYVREKKFVRQEKAVTSSDPSSGKQKNSGIRTIVTIPQSEPLYSIYESAGQVSVVSCVPESMEVSRETEKDSTGNVEEGPEESSNVESNAYIHDTISAENAKEEAQQSVNNIAVEGVPDQNDAIDDDDNELSVEERNALLVILQQPSSSSSLYSTIDKMYAPGSQAKHELKIAAGGLRSFDDENDAAKTARKGPKVNALGNTIYSKPAYLSAAPKKVKSASKSSDDSATKNITSHSASSTASKKNKAAAASSEAVCPPGMQRVVSISWEDAMKVLQNKLTPYHAIIAPVDHSQLERDVLVRSGSVPTVKVLTEKRAGNKTVTVIRQLDVLLAVGNVDLDQVTKLAQKKFACSCAVSNVPGIAQQREIVLQGPFAMDIPQFLLDSQGIPSQYIEVVPSKHLSKKKR